MQVSVVDAEARLDELVALAEQGEEVVLTRQGQPVARVQPWTPEPTAEQRRKVLEEVRAMTAGHRVPEVDAARSQDWLYDQDGLPV